MYGGVLLIKLGVGWFVLGSRNSLCLIIFVLWPRDEGAQECNSNWIKMLDASLRTLEPAGSHVGRVK